MVQEGSEDNGGMMSIVHCTFLNGFCPGTATDPAMEDGVNKLPEEQGGGEDPAMDWSAWDKKREESRSSRTFPSPAENADVVKEIPAEPKRWQSSAGKYTRRRMSGAIGNGLRSSNFSQVK